MQANPFELYYDERQSETEQILALAGMQSTQLLRMAGLLSIGADLFNLVSYAESGENPMLLSLTDLEAIGLQTIRKLLTEANMNETALPPIGGDAEQAAAALHERIKRNATQIGGISLGLVASAFIVGGGDAFLQSLNDN